jgi:hypothetical protein
MGDLPRRVPGGAGGQLGLFQQHDLGAPALMGEMIGQGPQPMMPPPTMTTRAVAWEKLRTWAHPFSIFAKLDRVIKQMYIVNHE